MSQRIVINVCFGGFGLSDAAYEKLIEWGIPVRRYVPQQRGEDGLYEPEPLNDGEVIFDRELTPVGEGVFTDIYHKYKRESAMTQRYWEIWLDGARSHPLLLRVVEELGGGHRTGASGFCSHLKIVEIPDGVEWTIEEYDGNEHIAQTHETWR